MASRTFGFIAEEVAVEEAKPLFFLLCLVVGIVGLCIAYFLLVYVILLCIMLLYGSIVLV